ncbi:MAG: DUF2589 domain-containing protein [Alphaproteobacteria bacterium]|nr:DUF2589 domain-containing protein [Alphaproteobacteria bacterium]MBU1524895.1 DUF2589 domain-containing protein [Alphaproteobacteria bacterium]MBU2117697.1 DUF2589 domain-containing protein [Alphaproteobacteria bacterium]MBU2352098.1 DUF2589 domain-containing protein [Alphaproteobacteria bacterium]MBU2381923.1 DUF2589 domain-containing protein [Alphaproteobacteria bacterium]
MTEAVEEFKGLPIAQLISGPLVAAAEAQMMLANSTADFIRIIGFQPPGNSADPEDPNALGPVRTAKFGFNRQIADPATGLAKTETIELDVPLLALVNVPALLVTTVDVTFDMEVKSSTRNTDSTNSAISGDLTVQQRWGAGSARLNIRGSVSSHKENVRSTDTSAKYHISVQAVDRGPPDGLQRVMNILHQAIVPPPPLPAPSE